MVVNQLLLSDALYHLSTLLYQVTGSITPNISINLIQYIAQSYIFIIIMNCIMELQYLFLCKPYF